MATQSSSSGGESSTHSPMEDILQQDNHGFKRREGHKENCKRSYNCHMRMVKNRGAIVVLIRNYLLMMSLFYLTTNHDELQRRDYYITWGVTIPMIGWLADVHLGRHKVIQWSMWIMWAGFMLATVSSAVAQLVESYNPIHEKVALAMLILAAAGFGGYQANAIQFGLDQLQDASTDEIISFITWYTWTGFSGGVTVNFAYLCVPGEYQIMKKLVVCICLSIALVVTFLSERFLLKEPLTNNPFKLIFKVLKYAIKTKQPRRRSAFTYCEDELPSRIDFGKSKYGGPFTTEQVEDVKTFFRLSLVICFGSVMPGMVVLLNNLARIINKLVYYSNIASAACYLSTFYGTMSFYSMFVFIPLYELIIYPVFRRKLYRVKSYIKFSAGILLQMARVIALMIILTVTRHSYLEQNGRNATIQCIFLEQPGGPLSSSFNIKWLVIPNVLNSLSIATLTIGGMEFVVAQTPYSMRGLLIGVIYGNVALLYLIGYGMSWPFMGHMPTWGNGTFSCGFWYLCLIVFLLGLSGSVLFALGRCYKMRKREDVLPNEQIFAERYYAT